MLSHEVYLDWRVNVSSTNLSSVDENSSYAFFLFEATSASWVQTIRHSVINYFLINALSGNANQTINIEIKIINYS